MQKLIILIVTMGTLSSLWAKTYDSLPDTFGFTQASGRAYFNAESKAAWIWQTRNISQWGELKDVASEAGFSHFIDDNLLDSRVAYYLVPTLPTHCGAVVPYACTLGLNTWIVPSEFSKLDPKERMIGLLQQRLYGWNPSLKDHELFQWSDGLRVFLTILEQIDKSGVCSLLTPQQSSALMKMLELGSSIGIFKQSSFPQWANNFQLFPTGGGRILAGTKVGPGACISVGSLVYGDDHAPAEIGPGTWIVSSALVVYSSNNIVTVKVGKNSQIRGSRILNSTIDENNKIAESYLYQSMLERDSIVQNSQLSDVSGAPGISLVNSTLNTPLTPYFGYYLNLGEKVRIEGTFIQAQFGTNIGKESAITNSHLTVADGKLIVSPQLTIQNRNETVSKAKTDLVIDH